jgi:hypothetical protein
MQADDPDECISSQRERVTLSVADLAKIFAGFTRIEFGPDSYEQIVDAWTNECSEAVQRGYLEEAAKYVEVFRKRAARTRGAEALRRALGHRTDICGAKSNAWTDDDDPPVTCTEPPGHEGDHAGGTRCGTVTWR